MDCSQLRYLCCALLVSLLTLGCSESAPPTEAPALEKGSLEHIRAVTRAVDDDALVNAERRPGDWLTHGRSYREERYSALDQINRENLDQLGLAWTIELGTKRGLQSTPLVVDGIMFFTGTWSTAYAVDARKGKILWQYDPRVDRSRALVNCCGVVNRGMALYRGAVFFGTLDGRLVSLDAGTGELNWEVQTFDPDSHYSITGAPRVVDGRVLIGNGGAEFPARGFISAYDALSGDLAWRFYTVPGDPAQAFEHEDLKQAATTWTGEWWKLGGGGTVWDSFVYDPELELVYIGVGNGSPWNRLIRSPAGGDNLYLSSIVAVKADTGEYVWHYQTTPGDTWDYTATQPIILADLTIGGALRKVLMQAPKNGFFYVLDRVTGEFISAQPYTYLNWATGIDDSGRPIETEGARYEDGRAHWITPGSHGGHNWFPMSYHRDSGLVFIPSAFRAGAYIDESAIYGTPRAVGHRTGAAVSSNTKLYKEAVFDTHPEAPPPGHASGRLLAYDPIAQREVWRVDQASYYNGGILSTAGGFLVQGDAEGYVSLRDVYTGEKLWQFDVRGGAIGSPVTYAVDGEQYISILVGWGGGQGQHHKKFDRLHPGTLYTFKLGGEATAPERLPPQEKPLTALVTLAAPERIGNGVDVFLTTCVGCHSLPGAGGGALPDLARSADAVIQNLELIVLKGAYVSQGMPSFEKSLSAQDVEDLRSFILYSAAALRSGIPRAEYQQALARMQKLADGVERETPLPETSH